MPLNRGPLRQVYNGFPRLQPIMRDLYGLATRRPPPYFTGWLMSTEHEHAWDGPEWASFRAAQENLLTLDLPTVTKIDLDAFRWRHWHIAYAVHHAVGRIGDLTAVECGVHDGMTAYIACRQLATEGFDWSFELYDAWAPMRSDLLDSSERRFAGNFAHLDLQRTQRNLTEHASKLRWHSGYIPESLSAVDGTVGFLHIDVNSSAATLAALEHFWPHIPEGGVILFDDYGWREYRSTKDIVDAWAAGRPGTLYKSPTGQAMYFR